MTCKINPMLGRSTMKINLLLITSLIAIFTNACNLVEDQGTTSTNSSTNATQGSNTSLSEGQAQQVVVNPDTTVPNNTGNTQVNNPTQTIPDSSQNGFTINQGAKRTNLSELTLDLQSIFPEKELRLSEGTNCDNGEWVPFVTQITIPISSKKNQIISLSVQYRDFDGGLSECLTQSIIHDDQGPKIIISQYPSNTVDEGGNFDIIYSIEDELSDIASVTCKLNNLQQSCSAGRNFVSIRGMSAGTYNLTLEAIDELGNKSAQQVSWIADSRTKALTQNIKVNDYKKVDILIVDDNSGSMQYEQRSMASRTAHLLSVIDGLDWQIAVTTTDPRNITLGDGNFIPLSGKTNQYILNSSMDKVDAQNTLSATLQRRETGSGLEQGIRSVYRAIEKSQTPGSIQSSFFRNGAQFAVLIISDEDESDNTAKNDPQNLINLINNTFMHQKAFSFHSIITRPGDTACLNGEGERYGDRLAHLSNLTGGIIGDVCATDYASQVTGIAQGIRDTLKVLTLQCEPLQNNGYSISIKKDGVPLSQSFIVQGVNLQFNSELEPGNYQVDYNCFK